MNRRVLALALSASCCMAALVLLLILAGNSARAQGMTLHVAPSGDCGGADPCYPIIQSAIDDASDGDTVKVAQGVYTTTVLTVVYISKPITLTGGYTTTDWVHSFPITQPTVIDAENAERRRGVIIDPSSAMTITLQALTIQRGYAQDSSAGGGGIYVVTGTVVLEDSRVLSNTAQGEYGGGIYASGGQLVLRRDLFRGNSLGCGGLLAEDLEKITIRDSTFRENSGSGVCVEDTPEIHLYDSTFQSNSGMGVSFYACGSSFISRNIFRGNGGSGLGSIYGLNGAAKLFVSNNLFERNSGGYGGGLGVRYATQVSLLHNLFVSNDARMLIMTGYGGGLCLRGVSSATIVSNVFYGNSTSGRGGGAYFESSGSRALLRNNLIRGNTADLAGGGLAISGAELTGINDVVADNSAPFEGVFLNYGGSLSARHWTVVNNGGYALTTDGGSAFLTNTIVSTHSAGGFAGLDITADHTLFFNSGTHCSTGALCTNSLSGDPRFVNPESGDYHIRIGSAAIDAGMDAGVTEDMDGQSRPTGPGYDLGADEHCCTVSLYLPMVLRDGP